MNVVITLENLTIRFGRTVAVREVNLSVPQGKIYGLLGENGAGKTSIIRTLMGLLRPSGGSVHVLGENPLGGNAGLLQRIGYVSDDRAMYRWMRVREVLWFNGGLYHKWDAAYAEQLREEFELDPSQKVRSLSRGQLAKLALLCALAPHPELLILDEASSGLDAIVRRILLEKLIDVSSREGTTIFLSSHLIEEVDRLAELVAILCHGQLLIEGDKDLVRQSLKRLVFTGHPEEIEVDRKIFSCRQADHETQLVVRDLDEDTIRHLSQKFGMTPQVFDLSLEDVFAEYTTWGKRQ